MILIKDFFTRNAFYLLIVCLFTLITVQLAIIPQLAAQDDDDDLPQPLPFISTQACTSSVHANVYVEPMVVNMNFATADHQGVKFTGKASGKTEEEKITSVIGVKNALGQTVPKTLDHQKIWVQIVFGSDSETQGLSVQALKNLISFKQNNGEAIPTPKLIGLPGGLDDWFSLRSHSTAKCSGNLENNSDSALANYYSYWFIGFRVCRGTGISTA